MFSGRVIFFHLLLFKDTFCMSFFFEILWVVYYGPRYGQSCIFYVNLKKIRIPIVGLECSVDFNQRCWLRESLRSFLSLLTHSSLSISHRHERWHLTLNADVLLYFSFQLLPFFCFRCFKALMLGDAHLGLPCVPEELPSNTI